MTLIEVRCCCQPQKVLGHLEVEDREVRSGGIIKAIINRPVARTSFSASGMFDVSTETITLPIDNISTPLKGMSGMLPFETHLAVKAEGLSVDELELYFGNRFHRAPVGETA